MTAAPADRSFPIFGRGDQARINLTVMRNRLRALVNPATGALFTEIEISAATAPGSRWANAADALDLILLAGQSRGIVLADQLDPLRANSEFLRGAWCRRLGMTPRPAAGGSGTVAIEATPGSAFIGSTTIGDPTATFGTDAAGNRYQVLYTEFADTEGNALVSFVGVDTGPATNLDVGATIKPANGPIGWTTPGTVTAKFRGGRKAETDRELGRRVAWRLRKKQASGNNAHFRGWAEDVSSNVEGAFVYACALKAGSVLVAITQSRGDVRGPTGRVPSVGTLAAVRAKITPPGSDEVPGHPFVVATGFTGEPVDMVARLGMPRGSNAGWTDLDPWPATNDDGDPTTITTLTSQTSFRVTLPADMDAPSLTAPSLMAWDASTSSFEVLLVASVALVSGDVYAVTLSAAPSITLAVGTYISPATAQHEAIASTTEAYFDTLGPGEVVELGVSLYGARAARFPDPAEEFPQRAGSAFETMLDDSLGSALGARDLPYVSQLAPTVPADPSGPSMLVAGRLGVYALDP